MWIIGLEVVIVEVSVTNKTEVRKWKKDQLGNYVKRLTANLEAARGGPFQTRQDFVFWAWTQLGAQTLFVHIEPSKDCGLNLAICCGIGDVETRNVLIPQDQLGPRESGNAPGLCKYLASTSDCQLWRCTLGLNNQCGLFF